MSNLSIYIKKPGKSKAMREIRSEGRDQISEAGSRTERGRILALKRAKDEDEFTRMSDFQSLGVPAVNRRDGAGAV